MEKKINDRVQQYVAEFKDKIKSKVTELGVQDLNQTIAAELLEFINEYDRLVFTTEDLVKRKRVKNSIPVSNRCIAKRASGEQCTRRRKDDCECCGTHSKGTPHGIYSENDQNTVVSHRVEAFAEEIKGIVYYIDNHQNVYLTEDVLEKKENPRIIAKWVKVGTVYTIPAFGI